jgi:hypothetical protein
MWLYVDMIQYDIAKLVILFILKPLNFTLYSCATDYVKITDRTGTYKICSYKKQHMTSSYVQK